MLIVCACVHACVCMRGVRACVCVCVHGYGVQAIQNYNIYYNNILFLSFFMYIFADLVKHSMLILVSEM